jgi:hypothetical protein
MPIDYKKYSADWQERRERILKRAGNKCEDCGVENHSYGVREKDGSFREYSAMEAEAAALDGDKVIMIVLTIAHLDHDEENVNVSDDRLKVLCQRCHLRYDVPEKMRRRKNKKAIGDLFQNEN